MALAETSGIYPNAWAGAGQDVNYPANVRQGLFGFDVGDTGHEVLHLDR